LNGVLNEKHRDVISDNIEIAFVGVTDPVSSGPQPVGLPKGCGPHNLVAKPCTSLTVSALPLDPATVENRTNVGVFLFSALRKDAAVMLLKFP
jgi:hypothetical protein